MLRAAAISDIFCRLFPAYDEKYSYSYNGNDFKASHNIVLG